MIELDARLILTVLITLWTLIVLAVVLLGVVHAVRVLQRRGHDRLDAQARPLVVRFALVEEDAQVPAAALRTATGAFGDRVDERLLSVLGTVRGEARQRIVDMLVERGHPVLLRRRARSRRTTTRAAAVRRLGQLGLPEDEQLLLHAVADRAPIVRTTAVRAVSSYPSPAAAGAVLEVLRGAGEVPSLVAVTSLIEQGSVAPGALESIRAGLHDPSATVRAACAQTLGELTSVADADRLALLLRRDTSPTVQLAAASAMLRVGRASSVPALLEGARSPWGPVRSHCVQALLALPRELTAEALAEIARRGDALLAPLLAGAGHGTEN